MLQQSKAHRDVLNDILKIIKLSNDDPNAFVYFYMVVQDYMNNFITFYMYEVYHTTWSSKKYPSIYIVLYIDDQGVKRAMIDEG